jgi:hypothetical protein
MATTGIGQPFNRQYPSGFTYPIDEVVFENNSRVKYNEYVRYKTNLYEDAIRSGTPSAQALANAGLIARRVYFDAAVAARAARDPESPTAATAPTSSASKTTQLSSAQSRQIQAATAPPTNLAAEPAQGQRNLAAATPAAPNKKTPANKTKAKNNATSNVLHNYTNYTYRLSLYTLKNSEFNKLVVDPSSKVSKFLILRSGGNEVDPTKNSKFDEDFYFEDLHLSTIIGLNARSRETNAIDLTFTIFEPNGCTLIDKLIDITAHVVDGKGVDNYLTMPYILQIDFLGYDAAGTPMVIPGISKIIPLTLIEMKIKPDQAGTRYSIRAVPFNHLALTNTVGIIPTNCEIKSETVASLFAATGLENARAYRRGIGNAVNTDIDLRGRAETAAREAVRTVRDENPQAVGDQARNQVLTAAREQFQRPINASSLSDVLNGWNIFLAEEGIIGVADEYDIQFVDQRMADAKVILPQLNPTQDVPTSSTGDNRNPETRALANSVARGIAQAAASTGVYRIFAGSTITNIISQVVRNSSFIRDQINEERSQRQQQTDAALAVAGTVAREAALAAATGGTSTIATTVATSAVQTAGRENQKNTLKEEEILQWFKITPEITLLEFDIIRNQYAKKIVFYIDYYKCPNPRYPFAPQGAAEKYVKDYYYWYTGKNTDVLNVDIAFDTAFYTAVSLPLTTSFTEVNSSISSQPEQTDADIQAIRERQNRIRKTGLPFPVIQNPAKQLADMVAASKKVDKKAIAVEDLAESLMSRSRGDMLVIKVEIIGDPEFIKQDGLFGKPEPRDKDKTKNNSIITDHERVIVNFNFNYPDDWNRQEGLLKPKRPTVFEGLYAIIRVDSTFERGIFKQSLEMYRLYEDQYLPIKNESTSITGNATINPLTRQVTVN